MKSPYFTEEHELFRQSVRQFLEKEALPHAEEWEKNRKVDREFYKKLGAQGFLGINHKEEVGGSNVDIFYSVIYMEELARTGIGGVSAGVSVHQYMATNHIANAGSEFLKDKYLKPSITGEMVAALAISEPSVGSDVSGLLTTAVREGEHYIINGSKTFITNGVYSDYVVVACKTDPNAGVNGISLIIVDRDSQGFSSTKLNKIGLHSSDTGELAFDNVKVPVENLVGEENRGFFYIMESFQLERLSAAVLGIGGSEACLEMTLKYMDEREVFGRKIKKYQVLRHTIVDLYSEIEAVKHLTYYAAWLYQNDNPPVKECTMAKLLATELSNKVVDSCLQCFGGYGYMEDYPIARAYRDVRAGSIAGGTSQIMREILSKMIIDDVRYKKVYNEAGQSKSENAIQTARDIIFSLPDRLKKEKVNGQKLRFHFELSGDHGGKFTVQLQDGQCTVSDGLDGDADCVVSAEAAVYEDVELGRTSPEMAVMGGQLKISNLPAMMQFAKLFNRIK